MYSGLGECRHGGGREPQVEAAPLQMTHTHYDDLRPWHCEPNIISQKQPRREEMRTRPRNRVDARNKHSHFMSAYALQISLRCFFFFAWNWPGERGEEKSQSAQVGAQLWHSLCIMYKSEMLCVCLCFGWVCLFMCLWVGVLLPTSFFFFFFLGCKLPLVCCLRFH